MLKKLTLLGMAIAAVAVFVAPAVAGAAQVTQGGKALATGTIITGVSTNWEFTSELGTYGCAKATVAGTLAENDGAVKILGRETGSSLTDCHIEGNPVTVTGFQMTTLESPASETGSGRLGLVFVLHLFGVECHFESAGASAVFHYTSKGSSIAVAPTTLSGPCGAMTFHATLALTAGGKAVELD